MAKRVSSRGIRKHRHYTYSDAADVLGVTVQTVRSWRDGGLQVMTGKRPHYILGESLIEFLQIRRENLAVAMARDQIFCLSCRAPRRPYGMMVDYVPITATRGRLVALCEVCEGQCQRFASKASIPELAQIFEFASKSGSQA